MMSAEVKFILPYFSTVGGGEVGGTVGGGGDELCLNVLHSCNY